MAFPAPYAEQLGNGVSEPVVQMIKEFVEKGQPIPPIPPIPLLVTPPPATDQLLGAVGRAGLLATSPETLNTGITFLSVRTAGQSAVGFLYAQDQVAKTFYALGFVFAGTAAGFSSSAVVSKACSVNRIGIVGETIGEACYQVAEEANRLALERDKKMIPVRKPIFSRNTGSAAFILPSSNKTRLYTIIINNVVFIITVYGYIKIIRTIWKKARRIILKKRQLKRFKFLTKSSRFLFTSIWINTTRKSKMTPRLSCNKSCLFSAGKNLFFISASSLKYTHF